MTAISLKKPRVTRPQPDSAPTPVHLLKVSEAADYARVSQQSIRRWIKAGELPIFRAGRQIRIDKAALVAFMNK